MKVNAIVRDKDPRTTLRRVFQVITAVGDSAPAKVTEWVALCIRGGDGDIAKVIAWAESALAGKVLHTEAVAVMRDVCARRLGDGVATWRGRGES